MSKFEKKVANQLKRNGNNAAWADRATKEHLDYVLRVYGINTTVKECAEIIRTIA